MKISKAIKEAVRQHQAGRLREAGEIYRQVLRVKPNNAQALHLLGALSFQRGEHETALGLIEKAISIDPKTSVFYINLGLTLRELGRLEESVTRYRQALCLQPDSALANNNLGFVLMELGRLQEAITAYDRALVLKPDYFNAHINQGNAFYAGGRLQDAVACYERALVVQSDSVHAHTGMGRALKDLGRLRQSITCYERALALEPANAATHMSLGYVLLAEGHPEAAVTCYERVLELQPDNATAYSNMLFTMNYSAHYTPREIFHRHLEFSKRLAEPLARYSGQYVNRREPNRKIRIGYISPDFRAGSVPLFAEQFFACHDGENFDIFGYCNFNKEDAVTQRFIGYSHCWRRVAELSDADLAKLIRSDEIDILVDLSGHAAYNRLLVFARRPAPIQVTYLGYLNTTGMAAIDYRISDAWADPVGASDKLHAETLVRLPQSLLCCAPELWGETPPLNELPARSNGYITFGCFNNCTKITSQVVALWCEILNALPGSRLLLKSEQFSDKDMQQRYLGYFLDHGIGPERIELLGFSKLLDFLAVHNRVDIALDPFPYNGGTVTCMALWMGVPVITLAGTLGFGRTGVSILSNVGLQELIAETPDAYKNLALGLAFDLDKLSGLRQGLRSRMATSSLTDAANYTRNLEKAYKNMWLQWCNRASQK